MAHPQINTCYWHLTKFTFAPPSIRPKLSIILHLLMSLFRKFPPTSLFNWNWKLVFDLKLLLRRYSRVSDLNISKDQRRKHLPYYKYMKRYLLKLDYLFCIVLICSEPQQVFKYMEYLKLLFYNHILKCYSNKINETRCNSLLPMQIAKDDVKSVKQHIRTNLVFCRKIIYTGNKTRV